MKNMFILLVVCCSFLAAQDKGVFKKYVNTYWKHIESEVAKFDKKPGKANKRFMMDFSGKHYPTSLKLYKKVWHNPSISQGNSGTCWCFSTTSFLESEIYRTTGKKVKLSKMYTVYWETVEKARRFIRKRGKSHFSEGSEGNAVTRMWKKYGIVPESAYTAMKPGQKFHNHEPMFQEMTTYLNSLKVSNAWNERVALSTIRAIMNHYIGRPPRRIMVDGKKITPKQYLESLKINLDDYVDFMSLLAKPYYKMVEYAVPDNWWHSKEYCNIPLDEFMWVMKNALRNGYSALIGGDISESGYNINQEVAIIPSYDIPSKYIDASARQLRFSNGCTTDDHGIHCVGYMIKDGQYWFLIKDSGSGSRTGKTHGYMYYHEDFIKLKMMNIMVHKDAAGKIWKKFQEMSRKKVAKKIEKAAKAVKKAVAPLKRCCPANS